MEIFWIRNGVAQSAPWPKNLSVLSVNMHKIPKHRRPPHTVEKSKRWRRIFPNLCWMCKACQLAGVAHIIILIRRDKGVRPSKVLEQFNLIAIPINTDLKVCGPWNNNQTPDNKESMRSHWPLSYHHYNTLLQQAVLGKLLCQCNILHIPFYFQAM